MATTETIKSSFYDNSDNSDNGNNRYCQHCQHCQHCRRKMVLLSRLSPLFTLSLPLSSFLETTTKIMLKHEKPPPVPPLAAVGRAKGIEWGGKTYWIRRQKVLNDAVIQYLLQSLT